MIWDKKRSPAVALARRVMKPPVADRSRMPSIGLTKASKDRRGAMVEGSGQRVDAAYDDIVLFPYLEIAAMKTFFKIKR